MPLQLVNLGKNSQGQPYPAINPLAIAMLASIGGNSTQVTMVYGDKFTVVNLPFDKAYKLLTAGGNVKVVETAAPQLPTPKPAPPINLLDQEDEGPNAQAPAPPVISADDIIRRFKGKNKTAIAKLVKKDLGLDLDLDHSVDEWKEQVELHLG